MRTKPRHFRPGHLIRAVSYWDRDRDQDPFCFRLYWPKRRETRKQKRDRMFFNRLRRERSCEVEQAIRAARAGRTVVEIRTTRVGRRTVDDLGSIGPRSRLSPENLAKMKVLVEEMKRKSAKVPFRPILIVCDDVLPPYRPGVDLVMKLRDDSTEPCVPVTVKSRGQKVESDD